MRAILEVSRFILFHSHLMPLSMFLSQYSLQILVLLHIPIYRVQDVFHVQVVCHVREDFVKLQVAVPAA